MRDEYTERQDYAKRGKFLNDDGTTTDQPHATAVNAAWFTLEARSKLVGDPLPPPDTHFYDDDTGRDVWSYSIELVRSIVAAQE